MKRIVSVLLVVGMLLCMVACGSKGPSGRYDLQSIEAEGLTITAEQFATFGFEGEMYITFNSDGTGELCAMDENESFTWKDNVMSDETGEEMTFVLEDDTITIEASDIKLVFAK